jgi:deoxyribodipyrimidine photolyase-related protein
MESDSKPKGGKWSFDTDNRKKLPNTIEIPDIKKYEETHYFKEAQEYVNKYFSKNYGNIDIMHYPITHDDARKALIDFLKNRFQYFGTYQDAETTKSPFVFHSILSPMMNIGLLTDTEVINETLKYENKVDIASFEGFIRQIIGWRNYVYAIYLKNGQEMKKMNFFKHNLKINKKIMWGEKETGILPIDTIIQKMKKYSYAHHIERLMYLGNFMLLCMIKPSDVYDIFMEWSIDSFDWVMTPNIFGMSQFCDGGKIMMKRPYFCSSNYILKMSDFPKGKWCYILDCLYYNFINKHKEYLKKNYATALQVKNWEKKSTVEKKEIIKNASNYLRIFTISN